MKKIAFVLLVALIYSLVLIADETEGGTTQNAVISKDDAETVMTESDDPTNCKNRHGAVMPCPNGCSNDDSAASTEGLNSSCSDGSETACESSSDGHSIIDNITFNYIHYANDWEVSKLNPGCVPCGAFSPASSVPTLNLKRLHRYRDIHEHSSFGPAVFSTYDISLQLMKVGDGSRVILFDPNYFWPLQYEDGLYGDTKDGVFYEDLRPEEKSRVTDKLTLFDDVLGTGNITADIDVAKSAVVRNFHGVLYYFEIVDMGNDEKMGRFVGFKDRNDYGVTITYKNFTPTEIAESPSRQFQYDTITDANGRVASFEYASQQVSGKWVVNSITLPNQEVVTYSYSGGYLTNITHPDGSESTFEYGVENTSNHTTVTFHDVAAESTHRNKTVYLTNQFYFSGGDYGTSMTSSSSLLVRMVVNGDGEISYLNIFPSDSGNTYVFEGGRQLKRIRSGGAYVDYMKDGWEFDPTGDTFAEIFPNLPEFHEGSSNIIGSIQQYYSNTPQEYITEEGVIIRALYDNENYITEKKRYSDKAYESYTYNEFKQKTRIRDMEGRVERRSYDSRGNLLTREVGIQEIAGVDVNQPEYAVYTWEYYPSGHANQFLKKAEIDANGNRTEYVYNAAHQLIQIIEAPDHIGDTQDTKDFTYDTYLRLANSSDEMGRVTTYLYDSRDRQIQTNYNDGSIERFIYGAVSSGDENLIIKKVDRNGNVTEYDFDQTGREIKITTGHLTMDFSGVENPVASPLTKAEEICTYFSGTSSAKASCERNGELTEYTFDSRNRWVSKTRHIDSSKSLTSTRKFIRGSRIFEEIDEYGRKTIYGYNGNTSYLFRIIKEVIPGNVFNYSAIASTYGQYINNAPYIVTSYSRDLTGLVTQITDPNNIKHKTIYDSRRRSVEEISAFSKAEASKTVTIYDANSNVIEVQHPRNFDATDATFGQNKTIYTYTGRNLLKTRTVGAGTAVEATESYTYTKDQREQTHTDFNGNTWTTIWHICCGRLEAKVDPEGNGTIYDVDYAGNIVHQYSGSGLPLDPTQYVCNNQPITTVLNETTTRFDERNRPTHTTQWLQPLGPISNKGRPALGNGQIPIAGEDGVPANEGLTTRFVYDDDLTDGVGLDVIYATYLTDLDFGINANGSAVEVTNPNGEKTLVIRDGLGRTIKTVDGVGDVVQAIYDNMVDGLVETIQILDPQNLALTTKVQADGLGRVQKSIDGEGKTSYVEYDNNSNIVKSRDANGVGLDCVFDNLNRQTKCTDTQGDKTFQYYDKNSNLVQKKDALNKVTNYVFDARERLVSTTNRIGGTVTQTYDNNSNLIKITDAENNATNYVYDSRNLEIERIFADSADANDKVVFTYDAVYRKISQLDQKGDLISYSYDMANRLLSRNYPDSKNDTFSYDPTSRLTQATSARYDNTITRTYNNDGTLASESLTAFSQTFTTSHLYDRAHRNYLTTYPNGKVVTRAFTDRNQLASIAYDSTTVTNFIYDDGAREISRTLGNNLTQAQSYRNDNLLAQKSVSGVTNFAYTS